MNFRRIDVQEDELRLIFFYLTKRGRVVLSMIQEYCDRGVWRLTLKLEALKKLRNVYARQPDQTSWRARCTDRLKLFEVSKPSVPRLVNFNILDNNCPGSLRKMHSYIQLTARRMR